MPQPRPGDRLARFGSCVVNLSAEWVTRTGIVQDLERKEFQVLALLLETPGRLITFAEFREKVWPDVVVEIDNALSTRISRIRKVLGDSSYIENERGKGYRFCRQVPVVFEIVQAAESALVSASHLESRKSAEGDSGHAFQVEPTVGTPDSPPRGSDVGKQARDLRPVPSRRGRLAWFLLTLVVMATAIVTIVFYRGSAAPPRVVNAIAVTHSGFPKYAPVLASNGYLYFTESAGGHYRIVRVTEATRESSITPITIPEPYACDLSHDGKRLLVRNVVGGFDDYGPLFIQGLDGTTPQPLPVTAFDANWLPDERAVVFARGPEVAVFDLTSQKIKTLARVSGYAWWPRWSPDGKKLRFTVTDGQTQLTSLWEVLADGSHLRRMFSEREAWGNGACGNWTPDGQYFVFQVGPLADSNLWLLKEGHGLLADRRPIQLTFGPSYRGPLPSPDGRKLFVRAHPLRAEMMKFDPATKAQSAFLPQVFSDMVSFSKDGRTLAYSLSDQEQTLWVSQSDGTSAHRLIPPPVQTAFPQWSPDGTRIAVATRRPGEAWRISLVSPGFGEVTELKLIKDNALHPSWSPDGKTILFGTIPTLEDNAYLYTVDLVSSRVSQVPGSKGLFTPMWSPDGRFIVAIEAKSYRLVLLDRATGVWSTITDTKSGYPIWSPDGKDIYSVLVLKKGVYLCRIQPLTRHVEPIIDLGAFRIIDRWIGLHPDGSFLVPKNDSVQEIFALDLQPPLSSRLF